MRKILKRLHLTTISAEDETPQVLILGPSSSPNVEHASEIVLDIETNDGRWQVPLDKLKEEWLIP